MRVRWTFLSTLFLLLLISACKKDSEITIIDKDIPEPLVLVETGVKGFVTDRAGNPLAGTAISLRDQQVQTDEYGNFVIKGLADAKSAVLKIEKPGYFTTYQTFIPGETAISSVRVQLSERLVSGSLQAANGGEVTLSNGAAVRFPAGGFIDEAGNPYQGSVNVFVAYIDPTLPDLAEVMPGNLTAINSEENLQLLQSFGMVNVEIEGGLIGFKKGF